MHGFRFWVMGFWMLVRLPFLMEDFSISKANLTKNPKPKTYNHGKTPPNPKPKTMNNNP